MAGSEVKLLLQARDLRLLRAISLLRIVDREQAQEVVGFRSTSRANVRLLKLTQHGLLNRFFISTINGGKKALYSLSPKGALCAQVEQRGIQRQRESVLIGDFFVEHQLEINWIYIAIFCRTPPTPNTTVAHWSVFATPISNAVPLIPDGYFLVRFREHVRPMFLEVDLGTETHRIWAKKIGAYLHLARTGEFVRAFGHPQFRVLVVATSERRCNSLRELAGRFTDKIFWFTTSNKVRSYGFWLAIWLRPKNDQSQSLL